MISEAAELLISPPKSNPPWKLALISAAITLDAETWPLSYPVIPLTSVALIGSIKFNLPNEPVEVADPLISPSTANPLLKLPLMSAASWADADTVPVEIDKPVVSEASAVILDILSSLPNEPVDVKLLQLALFLPRSPRYHLLLPPF